MKPNRKQGDELQVSPNLANQTSFPKWLEEISSFENNHTIQSKNRIYRFGEGRNSDFSPISSSIPSRISTAELRSDDEDLRREFSPKYGRRSIVTQMYFENTPRNLSLTSTDYLVPKFDQPFDHTECLTKDPHQEALENSWKSLSAFQQFHKGRLDSAKDLLAMNQNFDDLRLHFPHEYDSEIVPNTPLTEISSYSPYTISHIKKSNEENVSKVFKNTFKLSRSRSIDSSETEDHFGERLNRDEILEKKFSEYRMNVVKEQRMREDIINELFDENEKITERIRKKSLQSDNLYRTPEHQEEHPRKFRNKYNGVKSFLSIQSQEYEVQSEEIRSKGEEFIIPELPSGQVLVLDILSTWGDNYYFGLNGIEIFESSGKLATIKQIKANPPDVNVLPECKNDPRVVTNLLDGVNRTQDDMHIWLAPFYVNERRTITIYFENTITLGMMRIWNYNKSRIHSYRGVKDLKMYLDERLIFNGEIARASGAIIGPIESFGDTILFTTDDEILEKISKNDTSYKFLRSEPNSPPMPDRPPTASLNPPVRPMTGPLDFFSRDSSPNQIVFGAKQIDLILISNWGHPDIIGLTGLEVVDMNNKVINLGIHNISTNCQKRKIPLERLFNDDNLTTDHKSMWCTNYKDGSNIILTINLNEYNYISGLRIWNYNENLDASYAGVRLLRIYLDNKVLRNQSINDEIFLLRRAPGNVNYDFVQEICFEKSSTSETINQNDNSIDLKDETLINMPHGFVFQFIIYLTWGDQYYCGLNGIEAFNEYGKKIHLEEQDICAYPESVNVLPHVSEDLRTPDKLIDGTNDAHDGSHSWMAPIISKHLNKLYIVMDEPRTISYLKIWNYSKTPKRGVKDFGILVDDLLIYNGTLKIYSPGSVSEDCYQTVLFTHNKQILGKDWHRLIRRSNAGHDLVLLEENLRATTGGSLPNADPSLRPFTSVSNHKKPHTSRSQ